MVTWALLGEEPFDIRYVNLTFELVLEGDYVLPRSKASALRGGIGRMLIWANCIRGQENPDCTECGFEDECLVRRTMYSKFVKKPPFVTEGDSIGYVIECEDERESFRRGESLSFHLILFGRTIVYLPQYLQAVDALGHTGLGANHARFRVARVRNTAGEVLAEGYDVSYARYEVERLSDYVSERRQELWGASVYKMAFHTPMTVKYQGEFLREFRMDAILRSLQRRVFLLDCYEGIEGEEAYQAELSLPETLWQEASSEEVMRFSSRQGQKMPLRGIKGEIVFTGVTEEVLSYLIAGEVAHLGKNTSFGFGHYTLRAVRR